MNINLPPDQRAFIENVVQSGRFASADDAIGQCVRLLASREFHVSHIDELGPTNIFCATNLRKIRRAVEKSRKEAGFRKKHKENDCACGEDNSEQVRTSTHETSCEQRNRLTLPIATVADGDYIVQYYSPPHSGVLSS